MLESGRIVSNHTMYVFARDKYLKALLISGKINQAQYGQMEEFIYNRFQIDDVEDADIQPVPRIDHKDKLPPSKKDIVSKVNISDPAADYASLTDIAREYNPEDPGVVIQRWLQNQNTIEFLRLWEKSNNPLFNEAACEDIQEKLKNNAFTLTAKYWIEQTNGVGLRSKSGRGGGTFANPIIACEFLTGLSPRFKLLLIEMAELNGGTDRNAGANDG